MDKTCNKTDLLYTLLAPRFSFDLPVGNKGAVTVSHPPNGLMDQTLLAHIIIHRSRTVMVSMLEL
jgi:hypothetical protein